MKRLLALCAACLLTASLQAAAPSTAAIEQKITATLIDFLTHNADPARHANFWADDLVYTSSVAAVRTKHVIMASVTEAANLAKVALTTKTPPTYSATDIKVRVYEGFAALTFELIAQNPDGTVDRFRNSGTLVLCDGRWQAVTWQATRIPPQTATNTK